MANRPQGKLFKGWKRQDRVRKRTEAEARNAEHAKDRWGRNIAARAAGLNR